MFGSVSPAVLKWFDIEVALYLVCVCVCVFQLQYLVPKKITFPQDWLIKFAVVPKIDANQRSLPYMYRSLTFKVSQIKVGTGQDQHAFTKTKVRQAAAEQTQRRLLSRQAVQYQGRRG